MPKQAVITLGGRTWTLDAKPMGQHKAWRDKLDKSGIMGVFRSLDETMIQLVEAGDAIQEAWKRSRMPKVEGQEDENDGGANLGQVVKLARILPAVIFALTGSMDEIIGLLFAYDAKLQTERKWIEANAYDEEAVVAFVEVLKLAFPITALWGMARGPRAQQTSGSSVSQNGISSGLPASGPKKKISTSS